MQEQKEKKDPHQTINKKVENKNKIKLASLFFALNSKAYSSYLGWNLYSNINKLCIIKARVCQLSFPAFPMQVIKYHINIRKVYFYIRRNHNWFLNIKRSSRFVCDCRCLNYRYLLLVEVPAICKNLILLICLRQKKQYEFQNLHNSCALLYF